MKTILKLANEEIVIEGEANFSSNTFNFELIEKDDEKIVFDVTSKITSFTSATLLASKLGISVDAVDIMRNVSLYGLWLEEKKKDEKMMMLIANNAEALCSRIARLRAKIRPEISTMSISARYLDYLTKNKFSKEVTEKATDEILNLLFDYSELTDNEIDIAGVM